MMPIEHLILKATAMKEQLRKAGKTFEKLFNNPIREWLMEQPEKKAVIMGLARPWLAIPQPKEGLDDARMLEDLRSLVFAGAISGDELKTMLLNGMLDIAAPELISPVLTTKMGKPLAAYKIMVPPKEGLAPVHLDGVNKESVGKITDEIRKLGDVNADVEKAAEFPLQPAVLLALAEAAK